MVHRVLTLLICLVLSGCVGARQQILQYPNEVLEPSERGNQVGGVAAKKLLQDADCPSGRLKPHVGPLQFVSKYKGSGRGRDKLNEAALGQFRSGTELITDFEKALSELSREYGANLDNRLMVAECFVDVLARWAAAGALLHRDANHTGASMRKWALGTISANYLVVRPAVNPADKRLPQIKAWLFDVAQVVVQEWSDRPAEKVNNHDFWAAWATITTAVVLNDRALYDWSLYKYDEAMSLISEAGTIEKELSRQTRALAYHNYALAPLLHIAHFAYANGDDLLTAEDAPIRRLIGYVIKGLNNPVAVEQALGREQVLDGVYTAHGLAWIPIYNLYYDSAALGSLAARTDRYSATRLGGDIHVAPRD